MNSDLKILNWAALFEGTSLIVLLAVAMPLKYFAGISLAVKIAGSAHGLLFLIFLGLLMFAAAKRQVSFVEFIVGFIASLIPSGSFFWSEFMLKANHAEKE